MKLTSTTQARSQSSTSLLWAMYLSSVFFEASDDTNLPGVVIGVTGSFCRAWVVRCDVVVVLVIDGLMHHGGRLIERLGCSDHLDGGGLVDMRTDHGGHVVRDVGMRQLGGGTVYVMMNLMHVTRPEVLER